MSTPRLLIANEWLSPAATLPVTNPYTGAEIARVPLGDSTSVDVAIGAAQVAFMNVRAGSAHARAALLLKVAAGLEARRLEFVETIIAEAGKPVIFAEAEVTRA